MWSDITHLEENTRHDDMYKILQNIYSPCSGPLACVSAIVPVLNRFDWNPVAVRLPAIIAVNSGGGFGARSRHGWFGHTILESETMRVRTVISQRYTKSWDATSKQLTFMLKAIILLLGDIFGLGASSVSISLCFKRKKRSGGQLSGAGTHDASFVSG